MTLEQMTTDADEYVAQGLRVIENERMERMIVAALEVAAVEYARTYKRTRQEFVAVVKRLVEEMYGD